MNCATDGPYAGLMCSTTLFRSHLPEGCLCYVCSDCTVPTEDSENMILCQGYHLPFCGPCVKAGRGVRATGRVSWEWSCPTQAFCTSCDKTRKEKLKLKR